MTDTKERAELLALADRIDAWANLVSSGYDVPAAGVTMNEAASALRSLAAQDQKPVAHQLRVKDGSYCRIIPDGELEEWKNNWANHLASGHAEIIPLGPLYISPPPAAGWDIPDQITPELACIMENCGEPEMQTPEAVAALVRGYQPTWTKIVAALRHTAPPEEQSGMTEDQIKYMVDRFLGWKLPRDAFNPDCGISFDKEPFNTHTPYPSQHEPSGTNLFDATQATAMVRYMLEGLPRPNPSAEARLREAIRSLAIEGSIAVSHVGYANYSERVAEAKSWIREAEKTALEALSAHPHASDCDKQDIGPVQHWAVKVHVNGVQVLNIETEYLSGIPNIDDYAETVRNCANHLLSFIGEETTKSDPVQDAESASGAHVADRTGGAHPPTGASPSDRTADVTEDQMARAWKSEQNRYEILIFGGNRPCQVTCDGSLAFTGADEDCETFIRTRCARALLDAFTVGRR